MLERTLRKLHLFDSDNGTCKHCRALLFTLDDFSKRHKDRHNEVGTDIPCVWTKPRKVSEPETINKIRSTPSSTLPVELNPSHYIPSSNSTLSNKEIEKRVFNISKGNNSCFSSCTYQLK